MPDITIFQCLPAYRALPTNRLIAGIQKLRCRVLLDLEDSIRDVIEPHKSALLKQQARLELVKIFTLNPRFKFDVRVNSPNSDEYIKDMELINLFIKNVKSIFIQKFEDRETIHKVLNDAGDNILVNPIIETLDGFKNREDICAPQVSPHIEFFFSGIMIFISMPIFFLSMNSIRKRIGRWRGRLLKQLKKIFILQQPLFGYT